MKLENHCNNHTKDCLGKHHKWMKNLGSGQRFDEEQDICMVLTI